MKVSRKVLILDDEPGIRGAMSAALRCHGHEALCARGVQEAIEIAKREPLDVLIADLRLDDGNGVEALEEIRKIHPRVQAIVMTGYGTMESAVQALRLGAIDYLSKPFRIDSLLKAIERTASALPASVGASEELPWKTAFPGTEENAHTALESLSRTLIRTGIEKTICRRAMDIYAEAASNALRHNGQNQNFEISLSAWIEGDSLWGRIADTGKGFESALVVADALTQETATTNGLRFLHEAADDLRIRSREGQGCTVEFRLDIATQDNAHRIALPPIPSGKRWEAAIARIREGQGSIRIDGGSLHFLHPMAASELREAIAYSQRRGCRVVLRKLRLERMQRNAEANDIRKALWA